MSFYFFCKKKQQSVKKLFLTQYLLNFIQNILMINIGLRYNLLTIITLIIVINISN